MVALLGAGGMGEVYRAHDSRLGRDVAIKILADEFTNDPERRRRFDREARMLASLNHPHIGAIYGIEDSLQHGGAAVGALILELVEGQTLCDRIRRGALPIAEALSIAHQTADALDAAHDKGIVHRDLKHRVGCDCLDSRKGTGLVRLTERDAGIDPATPAAMSHQRCIRSVA